MIRDPEEPVKIGGIDLHPHSYDRVFNQQEMFDFFRMLQGMGMQIKFGFRGYCAHDPNDPADFTPGLQLKMEYDLFSMGFLYTRKYLDEANDHGRKMTDYNIFQDIQAHVLRPFVLGLNTAEPLYFRMFPEIFFRRDFLTGAAVAGMYLRYYNKDHKIPVRAEGEPMKIVNFGDQT